MPTSPPPASSPTRSQRPTGTINPFLRIQDNWFGGAEQGYNTNARPQFDETRQVTHALTLGQVPIVMVNGVAYREFLLDINQRGGSPTLSLDQLRIFLGNRANLDDYNSNTKTLNGHSAVFDMDAHGNVSLLLNGRLTKGDGFGDMSLLIPNSVFAGASPNTYVYLFSQFRGNTRRPRSNGGFEEWAVRTPATGSTGGSTGGTTATSSLSGNVFIAGTQTGISGVTLQLTGTDSQGNSVVMTATTDSNGAYTFGNLKAGTYAISTTALTWLRGGRCLPRDGQRSDRRRQRPQQ